MRDFAASGLAYLAQIENFYGCSLGELLHGAAEARRDNDYHSRKSRLSALFRLPEFFELKRTQWDIVVPDTLPEGRPVFWSAGGDVNQHGTSAFQRSTDFRFSIGGVDIERLDPFRAVHLLGGSWSMPDAQELKNLLMYADGAILIDPLSDFGLSSDVDFELALLDVGYDYLNPTGISAMMGGLQVGATYPLAERPEDFMDIIRILDEFRDLFENGTVLVIPAPDLSSIYFGWEPDIRQQIAEKILYLRTRSHIHHSERKLLSWVLLRRAKLQLGILAAYGLTSGFFCAGELDRIACEALVDSMISIGAIHPNFVLPKEGGEQSRLQELLRVQLPGVQRVRTAEMARLRADESMDAFRSTMRLALDASAQEDSLAAARRICVEESRRALRNLESTGFGRTLRESVGGDLAGLTMGALAGWSVDGWRGSLGAVVGTALWQSATLRPSPGARSLRHHYTELSVL